MEKNRFIEELFYELSCQLGKEFEMKQKRVWKNNGVSYGRNGRTCFVYGYVLTAIRTPG